MAAARGGLSARERARGTSCAAALTTRAVLNAAAELTGEDGPYAGQELSRRDLALLTRALAVNASRWPEAALDALSGRMPQTGKEPTFSGKGGSSPAIRPWGSRRRLDARGAWVGYHTGWCRNRSEGWSAGF